MDYVITRRTRLRPPQTAEDASFVHRVLTDPRNSGPFLWHGATPGVHELLDELRPSTLVGLVVHHARIEARAGYVLLTNPNLRDGHAFMVAAADPDRRGTGVTLEGLFGLVHLAFSTWPFHKLYADVDDAALRSFRTAVGRYLVPEGTFREHHHRGGRRVDVHRLALYRRTWEEMQAIAVGRMGVRLVQPPQRDWPKR